MNAFLDLADRQISAPVKARQRADEKRAAKKTERETLLTWWKHEQKKRVDALLAGPHGREFAELMHFLTEFQINDAATLLALLEGAWLHGEVEIRAEVLALVDAAIIALRERHDLPPFDDPLPGADPNVFLIARERLAP